MYTILRAVTTGVAITFWSETAGAQRPDLGLTPASAELPSPAHPPTTGGARLDRTDLEAWLDGFLPYALQQGDVAGAVVVVVKDGRILLSKGYGYADVARRLRVDPARTLFRPGSVAKLFTWTAVMQLVEQGRLGLDRDVNDYLDFKLPPAFGKPITLRNAMTHTPGFEDVGKNLSSNDSTRLESLEAWLKAWVPMRVFPPGQVPAYSNYATALAGYIVQRVSGEPFEEYIERHIFVPLGMAHSTFRQPLPGTLKLAKGYDLASGEPTPFEMVRPTPAGGLSTTGEDMSRFMIAHLQNGRYGEAQILRPETARRMHSTPLTIVPAVHRMLLGFYESSINGHRAIAHAGDTYPFHSDLNLFVDDGIGLFISLNSLGKDGASGAIRTAFLEQFADRYLPGPTAAGEVGRPAAAAHARLMAGLYDNSRGSASNFFSLANLLGPVRVTVNPDTTIGVNLLQGLNGEPKRWREMSPFAWRELGGKGLLGAKVENGKVVKFTGDEVSPYMMFLPTPWWRSSGWLTPALEAAVVALLLTLILWPVEALVRRHYRAAPALTGTQAAVRRRVRLAVLAVLIVLGAWITTLTMFFSGNSELSSRQDPWLWLLQLMSLVVFVGGCAVALWHARVVWTGPRRWPAKAWSVVLALACTTVLYTALVFKLIAFDVNY
jgi:CubicO group peptidase (beta-lactamase class C family)